MVPTTVLAYQHYQTFTSRLKGLPVRAEYLSRARSAKKTKEILTDLIRSGYSGYFVIEHFGAADQMATIERSVKFLNEIDKCNA